MGHRTTPAGLALIELLIAMALGITLVSAVLQFMIANNNTYKLNGDISRIQENGRIALDVLVRDLQMAGYRQPKTAGGRIPHFFLRRCNNTAANADQPADDNAIDACLLEGGGNRSDRIAIQLDPPPDDGTETDCLGNTHLPSHSILVNVYTIARNNGISSLYCRGYDASDERWLGPSAQPLVDGIDSLQILYGVAASSDAPNSVTKYISGDSLGDDDWSNIRAAKVAILVSNGTINAFGEQRERRYRLLDSDILAFDDRQLRRIFSTTVKFNN